MKKSKVLTIFTVFSVFIGTLTGISAYADSDAIESRGNLVFDGGKMSACASDMDYLQAEVQALNDELPSVIGVDPPGTGAARRDDIRSRGIIDYSNGIVVLDSSDFIMLADEIDSLEYEYKANAVSALSGVGTYFKPDGSITHSEEEEILLPQHAAGLSFDIICKGIRQSQSVDHLADVQARNADEDLLYYADESAAGRGDLTAVTTDANDFPVLIQPATAGNLTAGTASWVDGTLLIGNGRDNQTYYNNGYDAGYDTGYDTGYDSGYTDARNSGIKSLIPAITSSSDPNASRCITDARWEMTGAYKFADPDVGTFTYGQYCSWYGYHFPDKVVPVGVMVQSIDCAMFSKGGYIEGSDDGETWDTVYTFSADVDNKCLVFWFDNDKAYSYWRARTYYLGDTAAVFLTRFQLFGYE